MQKTKLIYNPHAGSTKHILSKSGPLLLQDIYKLLYKYEIDFDSVGTQKPGDARILAREASEQGYEQVIVVGGDGTVGEAANGLIGSNTTLGIIPLGTYMNVARMLSIPFNLESAVMLIKMGKVKSIDAGEILYLKDEKIDGKVTSETNYFLESIGIGFEADFQNFYLNFTKHKWQSIVKLIEDMRYFYNMSLSIELDKERTITTKSQVIMISNGPYMGAGLPVAPDSKLNDHMLTVTIFKMSKKQLFWHLLKLKIAKSKNNPAIQTYTSTFVKVTSKKSRPIDADARVFGETPISVTIKPNALKVIVGFAESKNESALLENKIYIRD